MKAQVLEANRRLATALGWTNIIDAGGALMGSPPWAIPHARGQMLVPNWAGDWKECGQLLSKYQIDILHTWNGVGGQWGMGQNFRARIVGDRDGEEDRDTATRMAIVGAVQGKLESGQ